MTPSAHQKIRGCWAPSTPHEVHGCSGRYGVVRYLPTRNSALGDAVGRHGRRGGQTAPWRCPRAERGVQGDQGHHHPARPDQIWPWIVQMGSGRGGWYALDWIDNKGVPSATRIVPELQGLKVGDVVPMVAGKEGYRPMQGKQRRPVSQDSAPTPPPHGFDTAGPIRSGTHATGCWRSSCPTRRSTNTMPPESRLQLISLSRRRKRRTSRPRRWSSRSSGCGRSRPCSVGSRSDQRDPKESSRRPSQRSQSAPTTPCSSCGRESRPQIPSPGNCSAGTGVRCLRAIILIRYAGLPLVRKEAERRAQGRRHDQGRHIHLVA